MDSLRLCKGPCGLSFPPTEEYFLFRKSARNGVFYPSSYCKVCEREKSAKKRRDNYATLAGKAAIARQNKTWRDSNPNYVEEKSEKLNEKYATDEAFRLRRISASKRWRDTNKLRKAESNAKWARRSRPHLNAKFRKKCAEDPCFRLRGNIRSAVCEMMKFSGGSKAGRSILKHLPYTMAELRDHISSLWEPWMTWENWGPLDKGRRTWQIDHVVPQARLPFKDFTDPNFLACWALSNLRPLESSLNVSKGCR